MHHVNPKLAHKWNATFKDISDFFPKGFFLGGITFLSLRNQKSVWNFVKSMLAVFEKKWFWLMDWLADRGAFISRVFPTGGWGEVPPLPPAQNLLIPPPPIHFPPPEHCPRQIFIPPPTKCQFPSPPSLNSNFQVKTHSKQHFWL